MVTGGNSFLNKLNKSGLRIQPCLTHLLYLNASVLDLLILIEHEVFEYKDLINEKRFPAIPQLRMR